ncbi:hypothetical protein R6Q57_002721 [Mikania cordata]
MGLVTEEINSEPPEIKKSNKEDTRGRPTLKAYKQKEQDVVKDNLASQESTFEPSRHSSFTAVTEKSQKPVFRRSRSTSVSKAMPPSDSLSQNEFFFPPYTFITEMKADMPHQEDVTQQGPPLDPETLALSQHEWLQFETALAAAMRCRWILRMSVPTPRCIDWGVFADAGEAVRARAILGEDTPWTRMFELTELPTYRLISVEFISSFRYRVHQAVVREEDDKELPPDIEFSLGGQHFEMSLERFAVHLDIYYEPETVRDDFTQGLTHGEEGVMRAWWAQISDTPFTGHRVRATMIRDPLIRYIHRCIMTTISGRGQSQEWVTTTALFYLHLLIVGRPCNLARCFALYYASFYHRQERDTLWGSAFVTHIARSRGMVDVLDDLPAIKPRKLDLRTIIRMKLAADIPGLGLRFIGSDGRPFQPAQVVVVPEQQQPQDDGAMPDPEPIREEPVRSPARGGAAATSTARLPCGAPDRATRGVVAPDDGSSAGPYGS